MRTTQNLSRQLRVPASRLTWSKQEVHAENHYRKLRKAGQTNQVQRHSPSEHKKRTRPKVAQYKTRHHHCEKPNEEKLFFHTHGHPPRPFSVLGGAPRTSRGREETIIFLDRRRRHARPGT